MSLPGEGSAWERIDALPLVEAVRFLQSLEERFRDERRRASKVREATLGELQRLVSDELQIKSRALSRRQWYDATKAMLGEEAADQFRLATARELAAGAIHVECSTVTRYPDETSCRDAGQSIPADEDAWVYPCAQCMGWHLTARPRADYWHVDTPVDELDDYADILADKHFWARLVDMPRHEAEIILRRTLYRMLREHQGAIGGAQPRVARLLARLKNEIHVASHVAATDLPSKTVFVELFGELAFEQLKILLNALEVRPTKKPFHVAQKAA